MSEMWVAFGAVLLLGGIVRARKAVAERLRERRQAGRVRGVARASIAEAPDGKTTCVVGDLVGELPLVAPFTGRRCVFWRIEVEENGGDAFETWSARGNEESAWTTFTISDGSGRAIIESHGAEIVIDRSAGMRVAAITQEMTAACAWLVRHHLAETVSLGTRRYRFRESALTADDPIAVVGVGVREQDLTTDRGYRELPPTVLRLATVGAHRLFITDAPDLTA